MHINEKLSRVRFALADIKSAEMEVFLTSLPPDSEFRKAVNNLKSIKHLGDVAAVEILMSLFNLILCDSRYNDRNGNQKRID